VKVQTSPVADKKGAIHRKKPPTRPKEEQKIQKELDEEQRIQNELDEEQGHQRGSVEKQRKPRGN
jgi:hypothetical protein